MIVKHNAYKVGYNVIATEDQVQPYAGLDFGVIKLGKGDTYTSNDKKERGLLLVFGGVTFAYDGKEATVTRESFLDENPICLHVPEGMAVEITAHADTEIAYQAVTNETAFEAKLYLAEDTITEEFGKGTMGETSIRRVRTIFDDNNAPYANMVIGEVINFPGKWSSYPAHHHCQPEIYHYRLVPECGFGFSCEGEDVAKVRNRDTAIIKGGLVHPQTAAPGYAMYYIWTIPHKPKRWLKDREFLQEDGWLLEENPIIWPDKE